MAPEPPRRAPNEPLGPRLVALVLLCAMASGLAAGAFASASTMQGMLDSGPRCLFLLATGAPCPFCGMSRATFALGRGDLSEALAFHPLAPIVLVAVAAFLIAVVAGKSRRLLRGRVAWAMAVALGLVWLIRLVV